MDSAYTPFEPVKTSDLWGVGLQQLMSGGMSLESIRNAADPDRRIMLSPKEQASLTEKIKDQYGGDNRMLRTAIGIATNPWIWLGAMVSPPAAEALRKGMPIFAMQGKNVAKHIARDGGILEGLGVLTSHHIFDGTKLAPLLKVDKYLRETVYAGEMQEVLAKSLTKSFKGREKELQKLGMKGVPTNFDEYLEYIARKNNINPKHLTMDIFESGYIPKDPSRAGRTSRYVGTRAERVKEIIEDITSFEWVMLNGRNVNRTSVIDTLQPTARVELSEMSEEAGKAFLKKHRGKDFYKKDGTLKKSSDEWKKDTVSYEISVDKTTGAKGGYSSLWRAADRASKKKLPMSTEYKLSPLDHTKTRKVEHEEFLPALMERETAEALMKDLDFAPWLEAQRKLYDKQLVMQYGNDRIYKKTGQFVPDERKIKTIATAFDGESMGAKIFMGGEVGKAEPLSYRAKDMMATILNKDVSHLPMASITNPREFMELMTMNASRLFKEGTYVPRNSYAPVTSIHGGIDGGSYKMRGGRDSGSLAEISNLTDRSVHMRHLHPEAYSWLKRKHEAMGITSGATIKHIDDQLKAANKIIKKNTKVHGVETLMMSMDGRSAARRYARDSSEVWSRFTPHLAYDKTGRLVHNKTLYGTLIEADEVIKKGGGYPGASPLADKFNLDSPWRANKNKESAKFSDTLKDIMMGKKRHLQPDGGITLADIAGSDWHAIKGNQFAQEMFRDVVVPHVSGRATPKQALMRATAIRTRETMIGFANGKIGKMIEGFGDHGKEFISSMREMAQFKNPSGAIAKSLYVGFLGLNMSSVMLNLMQPLIHATMFGGLRAVLPAYKDAFGEMVSYAKNRAKIPRMRLTDQEIIDLHQKSFKHVGGPENPMGDILGMSPRIISNIDEVSYASRQAYGVESGFKYITGTLPMKMFEKAELFNRLVSAHTVDRLYKQAGRRVPLRPSGVGTYTKDDALYNQWLNDVDRFVQETQFGGTPFNMPVAFMGHGPAGPILQNPLMRMFLTFPSRAFSSWMVTGKQIAPTRRFGIGGQKIADIPHWAGDLLRVTGTGALAYEIGKGMFNYDTTRGVGVQPLVEVMDAGWVPPIIKMPMDFWNIAVKGEGDFAKSSLPAVIPGGIGIVRALGMLPDLGNQPFLPDMAGKMQREFVDWNTSTPEGLHPIYKADGSLVNYDKPFNIIMKGLGINLENHPKAWELDGYLSKQKEIITKMEGDYMMALINNNVSKAQGIKKEFEKKYGVPMKVSKNQFRSKLRALQTPRTERIMDSMPAEYKDLFKNTLMERYRKMGMQSPQDILAGPTSGKRTSAGVQRTSSVKLDPETIAEIKKHLAEQDKPIEEQGFDPYKPWNQ